MFARNDGLLNMRKDLQDIIERLKAAGIENAANEARWILEDLGEDAEPSRIQQVIARRVKGEPLSRIMGRREFYGRMFALGPDTLDPRPDTETLIDIALQRFGKKGPQKILDLGTGTGCILITLLAEWPEAQGVAVDISPGALDIARQNAKTHGVLDRSRWILGSWGAASDQSYDLIVSNPPYIRTEVIPILSPEVQNHDPILALDGGSDGLEAYKIIFTEIKKILNPGGIALLEIGFDQEESVARLAGESGLSVSSVHRDIGGNPRVVEITCGDK
jgi:release factor glutamine methyltransferase